MLILEMTRLLSCSTMSAMSLVNSTLGLRHICYAASVSPEKLVYLLSRCSNLQHIQQTHSFMLAGGLLIDKLLLGHFVDACSSLGFSHYAHSVLTTTLPRTNCLYFINLVIKALSSSQTTAKAAIFLYNYIQELGLRPDTYSFPSALKAVIRISAIHTGRQLHSQSIRIGLDSELHVVTALIQMYSSFGRSFISGARHLFDGVSSAGDVALWNAMIAGYVRIGDLECARDLFEHMPRRNVISWTSVIAGYAQMNRPHGAIAIFRRMQLDNVEPDEIAMLAALSACAQLGALELGEWIHNYSDTHGLQKIVALNNALIDMYAKSGNITKALQVFEGTELKNIITWTTMIAGLALHGLGKEASEMFSSMEKAGVKPNWVTFVAILSACSHSGLVQIGRWYFDSMRSTYAIEPRIQHYGCMVDLLGRAGYLQEAHEVLDQMPFETNAAIWGSLLAAANLHGDSELGYRALCHLVKLEPHNSGNYALLCNIYSSLGMWNESRIIRKVMKEKGIKKMAGISFIEVHNRVHEFIAGETSNSQFEEISEVLCKLNWELRLGRHLQKEHVGLLEFSDM
ncbi:hypothetical protein K2173_010811 [Erythroxylum novogranatense]|uniref:Uncharacterized protein n=1 Tax=Erythroxylum novogranatense TaxID=1862640 RepID=A0AAV8SZQ8_9ROSI|nr:hypothetical protein K2173_010811 [Erythroxylum novogranatense]